MTSHVANVVLQGRKVNAAVAKSLPNAAESVIFHQQATAKWPRHGRLRHKM
jgi:hypothetical protein